MYTKFYNLNEEPFNLTPDPKFLYLGESHRKALTLLMYGVKRRKGFMVMTGDVGTGKTTLLHALLRSLDENIKTVFIFNPILNVKDFFKFVCFDLEIPAKDLTKGDCLLDIYQFLIESHNKERNVVMIIDEAHNLNRFLLEEIRLLSNFETAKGKLIQIILVGQPELSCTLNLPKCRALKQRIGLWFYINPFNQKETWEYITSRLRKAGMRTSCYTDKAINEIFGYSKGIPRLINILCDHSLTVGYTMERKRIDEKIVKEAILDLEASETRSAGVTQRPQQADETRPSIQVENPKTQYRTGLKGKKTKRWGLSSLVFWVYVLLLSGMLLLNFGTWLNGRKNLEPPSATTIKKPISPVDKTDSQKATQSPPS
jgi:general secretion pathway protein A